MKYLKQITLKNGLDCCIRNGTADDGPAVLHVFNVTHEETDYLASYADESTLDVQQESDFLRAKAESANEAELLAIVDGVVVGTAGINAVGSKYKVRHRAKFGMSVLQAYWSLGIGRELLEACIECAKAAGYVQLELSVVAENRRAVAMYEKAGFVEYGKNPKEFHSRITGFQEVIHMRLEL